MPSIPRFSASPHALRTVVRLALLAAVVGVVSAYAALGFLVCIRGVQDLFVGFGHTRVTSALPGVPWWRVVLAPAVGGLLVGLLVRFGVRGNLAHGPSDVIEVVHVRDGHMPLRRGLVSALACVVSIGAGASVGRYGPAVHLGGTIGSWLGRYVALDRGARIALLGAGVSGAIAAAFNAPLAGVLFAHEVVIGGFAARAVMPTVIASAVGAGIVRAHGNALPIFALPEQGVRYLHEYPLFLVVGLLGGGIAIAFMRSLDLATRHLPRIPVPDWGQPMLGGAVVGLTALAFPQVFGLGEEAIQQDLQGQYALWLLLALVAAKLLATSCSLGFGFYGGVLGPALFLGSTMGEAFGVALDRWFVHGASAPVVYAVAGMGAVISRVTGAPIATILIVFELTSDYTLTTAAMIAVVVASTVWSERFPGSYFHFQLAERGIDARLGREAALLRGRTVRTCMREPRGTVAPDATIAHALGRALAEGGREMLVVDEGGVLVGTAGIAALVQAERRGEGARPVSAVAVVPEVVLPAGTAVHDAMRILREIEATNVPVVEEAGAMRLVGLIRDSDLVRAYDEAVDAARAETS